MDLTPGDESGLLTEMYDQRFGNCMDNRECVLCRRKGDGDAELHGRLLSYKRGGWVHVNCIWWASDVYEHKVTHIRHSDRNCNGNL